MCKRIGIGMVRLSLIAAFVALLGAEANAATTCQGTCVKTTTCNCQVECLVGGTCKKTCILPKTGSEIFDITMWGVPTPLVTGCVTGGDEPCLEVQCSVYGTFDLMLGPEHECDPTKLDPDCGIDGVAICLNPRCHNRNDPSCKGNFSNGQPYILETPLTQSGFFQPGQCTKKQGRCSQSIPVDPELSDEICINPNWEFETFTAREFNGKCCTCDFGFDSEGICCGSTDRNILTDGSEVCVTAGPVSCGTMQCRVDLDRYLEQFQETGQRPNIPYDCEPLPSEP